jgi:hypothetical protein
LRRSTERLTLARPFTVGADAGATTRLEARAHGGLEGMRSNVERHRATSSNVEQRRATSSNWEKQGALSLKGEVDSAASLESQVD